MDRREVPSYGIPEAAHALALPVSTVRSWVVGQRYRLGDGTERQAPGLIEPVRRDPAALSYLNLVELYVLVAIRRRHKVSMPRVRNAIEYVQRELGKPRPLLEQEFLTDGVNLFVERYLRPDDDEQDRIEADLLEYPTPQLINASDPTPQGILRELLIRSLERIDRDDGGMAVTLSPWLQSPNEGRVVELNAYRAGGRLSVAGTGIPTESVWERFDSGESIDELAADYRLTREQVECAIRWEQRGFRPTRAA